MYSYVFRSSICGALRTYPTSCGVLCVHRQIRVSPHLHAHCSGKVKIHTKYINDTSRNKRPSRAPPSLLYHDVFSQAIPRRTAYTQKYMYAIQNTYEIQNPAVGVCSMYLNVWAGDSDQSCINMYRLVSRNVDTGACIEYRAHEGPRHESRYLTDT